MKRIAVVYWSGTGNTEAMANAIAQGIDATGAEVDVVRATDFNRQAVSSYHQLVFGCPSMGDEVLEESEFEPLFAALERSLVGKPVALFGSYGWGDGQWMRDWQQRTVDAGAKLFGEGLVVNGTPSAADLTTCFQFGQRFAQSL